MEEYLNLRAADPTLNTLTYLPAALAHKLVEALPESVRVPIKGTGCYYINPDHVLALTELLQEFVAYTVASIIDAGSERDAVMENEELSQALELELKGWTPSVSK